MLMLSLALNYNSAHFTWPPSHGPGPQHPWGLPTLGWTMGTREQEVCGVQSLFLQKPGAWGALCTPKSWSAPPASPARELLGVSRQSCAQLRGSPGFRNCSNEPSGAAGFPPIPAFQSLQSLTNASKRSAGHWDGAGCQRVLQHQTKGGSGCFGVRAGGGWRCVVRTGLQQPRFSKGAREALNNWDSCKKNPSGKGVFSFPKKSQRRSVLHLAFSKKWV